eukprot:CAMPEP_0114508544 /NCGR_PEP_ID=MMETSP0109-20121206/12670_1 /TAXON_ID=29199 /ORGANISM="Chlorarachnion reptans, Strain CCCM449" /LENGTH=121 /DNA_ID=CAMNT_0001687511 /DNA_START=498 /DNA_END=863 /DNA_ORIENTATION=-
MNAKKIVEEQIVETVLLDDFPPSSPKFRSPSSQKFLSAGILGEVGAKTRSGQSSLSGSAASIPPATATTRPHGHKISKAASTPFKVKNENRSSKKRDPWYRILGRKLGLSRQVKTNMIEIL